MSLVQIIFLKSMYWIFFKPAIFFNHFFSAFLFGGGDCSRKIGKFLLTFSTYISVPPVLAIFPYIRLPDIFFLVFWIWYCKYWRFDLFGSLALLHLYLTTQATQTDLEKINWFEKNWTRIKINQQHTVHTYIV